MIYSEICIFIKFRIIIIKYIEFGKIIPLEKKVPVRRNFGQIFLTSLELE